MSEASIEAGARGRALLRSGRPGAGATGDDRLSPTAPPPAVAMAGVEEPADRLAADRPAGRVPIASCRESPPARLRSQQPRELPHRWRTRPGEGPNVDHPTSPELRSPATVGRT